MRKIPPAYPSDPTYMERWYQYVRDELANPELADDARKRTRGRNERTAAYSLNANDAGKVVVLTGSSDATFTLDASDLTQNDRGRIRQEGTGQITVAAASGTSLRINGDFNPKTRGQWAEIEWERISTTEIILTGQLDPITTISFHSSNTSTSASITIPSGAAAGDVLVLVQRAEGTTTAPADVTPTGWTDIGATATQEGAVDTTISHKYRIAQAGDAGSSVTGMNGNSANHKIILVFRPTVAATTVTPASPAGEMTDDDPSPQVVTSGSGTAPLIVMATYGVKTGTKTGISLSPSESGSVTNSVVAYYKIYNSSPANVTADLDDGGTGNSLCSFYLEVA